MIKKMLALVFLFSFAIIVPDRTMAAEGQPYSVKLILPSNQDQGISNYFSISSDNEKLEQEFEYIVTNKTSKPLEIEVTPLNALTSPNGVIQYTEIIEEENAKIIDTKYGMAQYIDIVEKINLEANESKIITAAVKIPEFKGSILGGIGFHVFEKGEMQEKDEVQFRINNEMNTVIGMHIKYESEKSEYEIGEPFVSPLPSYYAIRLPIALKSAALSKDVSIRYEVLNANHEQLFRSEQDKIVTFAPKTMANISLPWQENEINVGETYILKGTITTDEEVIPFEKEFKFDGNTNLTIDGNSFHTPSVVKNNTWWWVLGLTGLLGIVVLWILLRRKKQNQREVLDTETI